jgi:hypothetical protein
MDRTAPLTADENTENNGVLLGPEPQSADLLIEETIPLSGEFQFGRSPAMLLAGLKSVEPALTDAREHRPKAIVGFYRIVMQDGEKPLEVGPDFLIGNSQNHPLLSNLRCCFLLTPQPPRVVAQKDQQEIQVGLVSEILLRALKRDSEQWKEIAQVTLQVIPNIPVPAANRELSLRRPENSAPSPGQSHVSRWQNRAVLWAIGLASMIGAASGYLWVNRRPTVGGRTQVETPAVVHTRFSANRDGAAWKLTWDTTAVETMKPTAGILSIQDGTGQQDIALSMADLSGGTIYYSPNNSELAFQLQVQRDGVALSEERIRVLDEIRPITKPLDQAEIENLRSSRLFGVETHRPTQATGVIAGPPAQSIDTGDDTAGKPRKNLVARNFLPPSSGVSLPQSIPVLSAAEPLTTLAIPVPLSPEISSSFVGAPAPPSPVSATPPAEAQPLENPVSPKASATALAPPPSSYAGPKPTKQVQPRLPPGNVGVRPAQVQVALAINTKGKVTNVKPLSTTAEIALMAEAIKAAFGWEFEPARLNGQPVPSEMNLIFHFR